MERAIAVIRCVRARLRAELRLEGHVGEYREPGFERLAPILLPEELGIREPRPHHAFVAGAHDFGSGAVDIADRDETRHQRAIGALECKISLMILQCRDQHLARQ